MNIERLENELMSVDLAFSERAQVVGITEAFIEFAADDAVMYRNGRTPIVGKAEIREVLESEPEAKLIWKPTLVEVAESGDLGYTRGKFMYSLIGDEESGPALADYEGHYISVWKRQEDGSWKWVFDTGIISRMPETTE